MRNVPNRAPVRNHHDLPLFQFAALAGAHRRMTLQSQWVSRRYRIASDALARTVAELAGFPGEEASHV